MPDQRFQIIERNAVMKSCRRPLKVGLYDDKVEKTFISWMGAGSDIYVASYDHRARDWSDPQCVGGSYEDYHNYPHIIQSQDGILHVFHGCHSTPLKHAVAPTPRSITGDWTDQSIEAAPESTYPMPVTTKNGDIFVFYRHTIDIDDRPLLYIRSTDNGQTWRTSRELTDRPMALGHTERTDNLDEIYMGQLRREPAQGNRSERFHMVWTIAGGGPDEHNHDGFHRNVYYATFDPDELRFSAVNDTDLGHWLDEEDAEEHCKVLDTGPPSGLDVDYIQFVHFTRSGTPVLAFGTTSGQKTAYWTGSTWEINPGPAERNDRVASIRDIERIGATSFNLYLDHEEGLQIYRSEDAGRTWQAGQVIDLPLPTNHAVVIDDHRSPIDILATEATDWESMDANRDLFTVNRPAPET